MSKEKENSANTLGGRQQETTQSIHLIKKHGVLRRIGGE